MSITFAVDNVKPNLTNDERFKKYLEKQKTDFFISGLKGLGVRNSSIEAYKFNTDAPVHPDTAGINSLVSTCLHAFDEHMPLTFGPDEIWIAILQAFSQHIATDPEAVRKNFVQFEGKQKLTVRNEDFVKGSPDNNWDREFGKFSDLIAGYLGKKRDFFDASFTTTGPVEKSAIQVQMMSVLAPYFDYGMHTMCGVPSITLLGEARDWEDIFQRVKSSAEFFPDWAREPLERLTSNFASSAAGKPPLEYWKNFVKINGGSGGPYISGHINALFPYLTSYKKEPRQNKYIEGGKATMMGGPTAEEFPASLCAVPMEWKYYDQTFNMKLVTGIVGRTILGGSYRPVVGWLVGEAQEG